MDVEKKMSKHKVCMVRMVPFATLVLPSWKDILIETLDKWLSKDS